MNEEIDERVHLAFEDAVAMLPDGDSIHTFRQAGLTLLGVDWPREKLIDTIRQYGCELSGPAATNMQHGLVLFDEIDVLFIETRKAT